MEHTVFIIEAMELKSTSHFQLVRVCMSEISNPFA